MLHAEIDEGIQDVCRALNLIEWIVTINSCQGGGNSNNTHCSFAYVDFFVLNHEYAKAHDLFIFLTTQFDYSFDCSVSYEEDGFVEDDIFIPNGDVVLRHRIKIHEDNPTEDLKTLVRAIESYHKKHKQVG